MEGGNSRNTDGRFDLKIDPYGNADQNCLVAIKSNLRISDDDLEKVVKQGRDLIHRLQWTPSIIKPLSDYPIDIIVRQDFQFKSGRTTVNLVYGDGNFDETSLRIIDNVEVQHPGFKRKINSISLRFYDYVADLENGYDMFVNDLCNVDVYVYVSLTPSRVPNIEAKEPLILRVFGGDYDNETKERIGNTSSFEFMQKAMLFLHEYLMFGSRMKDEDKAQYEKGMSLTIKRPVKIIIEF